MTKDYFDDLLNELEEGRISEKEMFFVSVEIFRESDRMMSEEKDHIAEESAKQCIEFWKRLLKTCDEHIESLAFGTFSDWVRECALHEHELIEKMWMECFQGEDYDERKIRVIDERLAACRDEESVSVWAARRIALMKRTGFEYERDGAFEKKFPDNHLVRKYIAERYLAAGENAKALAMIRKCMQMDSQDAEITEWCCRKLTRICRFMDVEIYREALHEILTVFMPCDMTTFRNLRNTYSSEEWYPVRSELFEELREFPGVMELYVEEGQYNRLMEYLKDRGELEDLLNHEELLGERYAVDILAAYERILDEMLRKAVRRKHYRQVIEYARRLEKYPGGENRIYQIADRWREEYGRKTAFLMELAKL